MIDDLIIGTGPTAWAAAEGVIARGGFPVLLDFGLHPNIAAPLIKGTSSLAVKGDSERATLFSYPKSLISASDGRHLPVSSARGGLSKIWGAGILMRSIEELSDLEPISNGLNSAFHALYDLLPSTGSNDQLSNRFPLPSAQGVAPTSSRYENFISKMQKSNSDVLVGHPRMAMKTENSACVRCGMCLNGCPESLFFSADLYLKNLELLGKCKFEVGPALSIESSESSSIVRTPFGRIEARRIYLAAGPIATPALLQRSNLAPTFIEVMDSAVFYSGLINQNVASGNESEFTSSNASIFSDSSGADDFQIAVYESNPEYLDRIKSVVPKLGNFIRLPKFALNRINPVIGFLDSSVSGRLELNYYGGRTWVKRRPSTETRAHVNKALTRTSFALKGTGIHVLKRMSVIPVAGSGYHSGASLPMGGQFVDFDARLKAAPSVMLVDATSLPNIPAGSHTFTAMANAYRVAVGINQ